MFESLGHDFVEINFAQPGAGDLLNRTIAGPVEFAFSFMGMAADLPGTLADGKQANLWQTLNIPFITLFGDTPAYFFDRHVLPKGPFASSYAFPEHAALRKQLPKADGLIGIGPPLPLDVMPRSAIDFKVKKNGKLLFLKNGNDPAQLLAAWREGLPESTFIMLADLASELAATIHTPLGNDIDGLVTNYFKSRGLDIQALISLRLFFIAQLDDYLRRVKSTFMAEVLRDFPVEIHGYNWEHVDFSRGRATYVHGGDYGKSRDQIRDSLGLIDMSPNTSMAPHERPLRAFGMYTLCLTNEQAFFSKHVDEHEQFMFRFEKESLANKITEVLAHPDRFLEIGTVAAESFRREFTPERTAQYFVDMATLLRLGSGQRPANLPNYFVWPPSALA